jgi:hypothetical protein
MNLTNIAKKILSEDSWGTNPSAAGGMSPGRAPTANTPPPAQSGNTIDISQSFKGFKTNLEKQKENSVKKFQTELKSKFLKKTVTIKASKGSVGQIEKEYTISVNNIEVRYMKDKYYVVFIGKEGGEKESEYYLDDSEVQVNPQKTSPTPTQSNLRNVGGIVPLKPTPAGVPVAKNIIPQG